MTAGTVMLIILAALVATVPALWQYAPDKRWLLVLLRFITYFCIFLLLINPKFRQKKYTTVKPVLAVAVDNSRSVSFFNEEDRVQQFVSQLRNDKALNDKFDIDWYSFGRDLKKMDSLSFTEPQTRIGAVFTQLQKLYKEVPVPTVLISDGNQTVGTDYEFSATAYPHPVYPVIVGDTAAYEDLKIERINANRYAFLDNHFPVEIFVNYDGDHTIAKRLLIKEGSRVLYEQLLHMNAADNAGIIEAKLKAQSAGIHTFTVAVETLENEKNTVNNQQQFAVEVIDERMEVLILASFPHPDAGSLKKAVESNPHRKVTLQYIADELPDLEKYRLIVLYQPDARFETVYEQIEKLRQNTLTVTGTQTNYDFLNRKQPFFSKEATGATEYFLPVYRENYSSYQFEDIGFEDYPPLLDRFGMLTMLTDYQPLLFQNIGGEVTDKPLLFTAEQGQNRYGFLLGENSWQWRAKDFSATGTFEKYDDFINRLVQYLAADKPRERLTLDFKSFYNTGDQVVFRADYFDKNYQFDPNAQINATFINQKTNRQSRFSFVLKNTYYQLDISSLEAGDYRFRVEVPDENLSQSGSFTIVDYDVEKQFVTAGLTKMKKLGKTHLYFPDRYEALAQELMTDTHYKPVQKSRVTVLPLISWKYLLFIMAACLFAEWLIRKYNGLV